MSTVTMSLHAVEMNGCDVTCLYVVVCFPLYGTCIRRPAVPPAGPV